MNIDIPASALFVLKRMESAGFQSYIVGGCVRDSVLGKQPHDWDICTDALPENVVELFGVANTIPTGIKHGTVSVKCDGNLYEVTTFRVDGEYHDGRHPDNVTFVRSLQDDLARRDFTINAMAYNESRGLVDPFGGYRDCEEKMIRAVGDPDARFTEDALRILRAVRFSAVLGFSIENNTKKAMRRNLDKLQNVSRERIGNELYKTVTAPYAARALQMDEGAVIRYVCPELDACYGCEQNNRYHYMGVFSHTMKALENAETCHRFPDSWADGYVRMALLLHDIGKPATKTTDEDGHDHFYGHSHVSADMALNVLKRYRYSNEFVDTVVGLIDAHAIVFTPTKATARRMLNKFGVEQLHRLLKLRECDNRAHTSLAFERFEIKTVPFETILQQVLDEDSAFSIKDLTVNGHDIIKMGYKEGPEIGNILKALLDAVITDTCENTKEALTEYIKNNC